MLPQGLEIVHRFLDGLPGGFSRRGQGHTVLAAQKELRAQFGFHVLQTLAQGRLRQIELFCRAGQVSCLRKGKENQKIFFVHEMFRPFFAFDDTISITFLGRKFKTEAVVHGFTPDCCGSN